METLRKGLIKLEQQKQNLTAIYIDPDIQMTRSEYLEQRGRIDDEIQSNYEQLEAIKSELSSIPIPADFESLEKFASKVRDRLAGNYELKPEDKRPVLELLHVKVYIGLDGSVRPRWLVW